MRPMLLPAVLALATLAGCASTLPVRDFRAEYERAPRRDVRIDGYAPFVVYELQPQRRLQVRLNFIAQAIGWIGDPLQMIGVSDGIPSRAAHEAAARRYLEETNRASCPVAGAAVTPSGREFEFTYTCP